jgi:hypothetical protein
MDRNIESGDTVKPAAVPASTAPGLVSGLNTFDSKSAELQDRLALPARALVISAPGWDPSSENSVLPTAGFGAISHAPEAFPGPQTGRPFSHQQSVPDLIVTALFSLIAGLGTRQQHDAVARNGVGSAAPAWVPATSSENGVAGVRVGHSTLMIPLGDTGYAAPADWYFPTQQDGSVQPNGVIWLQHGFMSDKAALPGLATQLAETTNSIVVVPDLPSIPLECADCWIGSAAMQQAVAAVFDGRAALTASASAAGLVGALPDRYLLAGHSAGGGFAAAVAGYAAVNGTADDLLGVIMYDGVAIDTEFTDAIRRLDTLDIPVYQLAGEPQIGNLYGLTTDALAALRPDQFTGVSLRGGSPVDALLGADPLRDVVRQLLSLFSPPGNTAALYSLSAGWIEDLYAGAGPADPQFGIYGAPGEQIVLAGATATVLPQHPTLLSPLDQVVKAWMVTVMPLLSELSASSHGQPAPAQPSVPAGPANGVVSVNVGHSDLTIPMGEDGYTAPADWYFPTQGDGSVQPNGVIWLQHGFLGDKQQMSVLATQLAQQTNSIVVVPSLPSFPWGSQPDVYLTSVDLGPAIAEMFLDDRAALNASAAAAGYQSELPQQYILAGHSFGGGLATAAGGEAVENGAADGNLLGVIMFDGVAPNGTFAAAVESLDQADIPIYQIAAPAQVWNNLGETTNDLDADDLAGLRPDQFVGVMLVGGSHFDAVLGAKPISDLLAQLLSNPSPEGNTEAAAALAAGWINDMYVGAGPDNPRYGVYGSAGDSINIGKAVAVVLPTAEADAPEVLLA